MLHDYSEMVTVTRIMPRSAPGILLWRGIPFLSTSQENLWLDALRGPRMKSLTEFALLTGISVDTAMAVSLRDIW